MLYSSVKMDIPEPHFIMFYNGKEEMPEEITYALSDLYIKKSEKPDLELSVKVYNINKGMNTSLMKGCKKLEEYSLFVAKVREYESSLPMSKAIPKAVDYCIDNDILRDFLIKERKTIIMYSLFEYDQAEHMKYIAKESKLEGKTEGIDLINELNSKLAELGRSDDIIKASKDHEYQMKLIRELIDPNYDD
jgi:hypothetical protein